MTLTQLRYAVAVDTHRHFGRAADACHISQPTLSVQLRKLEDELGIRLFDRRQVPVRTTDIGRRLIEQARVVLREADRLPALVSEVDGKVAGELRLGMLPTLAPYVLPLVAAPFAERYPDVVVIVQELRTDDLLSELTHEHIDAGLIATDEQSAGFESEVLFSEPFVGYVGSEHPLRNRPRLSIDDLQEVDLWLLSEGHCFREQVLEVCGRPASAEGPLRFESGTLETLRRLVDRNGGVTLLPATATLDLSADAMTHVRPFAEPVPRREVRLAHGHSYLNRAAVRAFGEVVREEIERLGLEESKPTRPG